MNQLQKALDKEIEVLFITNHNTLDGYSQIIDYQKNHEKFANIKIYPAEEITIEGGGHVIAYGIYESVKPGMPLEETLDEIKRQSAISCAAHPFAVTNGIREKAAMCDIIESFNSNNVDRYSNLVATFFAKEKKMPEIAGSDSHVLTTVGRCMNVIEAENNLDSILSVLRNGTRVDAKGYASRAEIYEHAHYIISNSRELLLDYTSKHQAQYYPIVKWALDSYAKNPDSFWWRSVGTFALYLAERISEKVNIRGYNPDVLVQRSWSKLIPMGLMP